MARRKLSENNIRKLTRSGGGKSIGLTLPKEMVDSLGWQEKQRVVVKRIQGGLVIRDYRAKK
ncbi:MAG: hypothetical protein CO140_03355 [Candidatus Moranbacteria bacterium CG_4_9_14_3_um_filter_40_7]|nr:MAG: hypothetical protein COX31_03815 [Candidatus Moranbacteria bacterium CG23_combo_of_CG06-09_8_20_14_all_40_16]PIU30338.1 MAG: hypothetical protein COT07_01245 [Candidatus Woesearchaeota archaeon CG07_land_8_20_14_0_80_44_23]PJA87618.1 MAG: hypothetical protein CO140_03355 [Candidatus Moranbacteria bacterium CG_4_9_14_3_um_filter_40_7]